MLKSEPMAVCIHFN